MILAFTIPSIFFGYIAGVYVDHQDLKKVLTTTNLLRGLCVFLLIFVMSNLLLVYLLVLILALVTLFFLPAEGSALPALVKDKKDLLSANSLFTLTYQSSLIIGFLSAGPILSLFGEKITVVLLTILFVLALAAVWLLPNSIRSEEEKEGKTSTKSFFDGLVFFFKTKTVREAIFLLTATQAVILVLATIAPGFVDKVLNLDVRLTSIVLVAPAALGMIVGSFVLSHFGRKQTERTIVNWGLFIAAASFLALTILERQTLSVLVYVGAVAFIILLGVSTAFITIPATTEMQSDTPENLRGRTYGILGTFVSGVSAIPVLLAGALGDTLGVRSVLLVMGVLTAVAALYRQRTKSYTET